ncbi:MAG: hypothetical protein ACR2NW_02075 [Thermodesulfobacteriota bacterium]
MCNNNLKVIENLEYAGNLSSDGLESNFRYSEITADIKSFEEKIFYVLFACMVFFAVLGFAAHFIKLNYDYQSSLILKQYVRLFLLDESSVSTWYSSTLFIISSFILGVIAYAKRKTNDEFTYHWIVLSVIFLFLSIDDITQIHERLNVFHFYIGKNLFKFSWILFGTAFTLTLFLIYFRFIFELPDKIRNLFIISGILFVSGAIGFEIIGWIHTTFYFQGNLFLILISTLEETLEMLGTAVFIYALLTYVNLHLNNLKVQIDDNT